MRARACGESISKFCTSRVLKVLLISLVREASIASPVNLEKRSISNDFHHHRYPRRHSDVHIDLYRETKDTIATL